MRKWGMAGNSGEWWVRFDPAETTGRDWPRWMETRRGAMGEAGEVGLDLCVEPPSTLTWRAARLRHRARNKNGERDRLTGKGEEDFFGLSGGALRGWDAAKIQEGV